MTSEPPFGQLVRARRRALDLTQEELAHRVGCATITVRKIEAGVLRPSQQIAERLAVALGLPPDERPAFVRFARSVRVEPAADTPQVGALTPRTQDIGAEDLSGWAIRGYRLGGRLGIGSFGAVYHAFQPQVERPVAIKIILPQYADHPDFVRRFEHEARVIARLEHPHIVPLYDYWREPGVAYLVMRLLRGSLQSLLAAGRPDSSLALRLAGQIIAALAVAHRAGVVHRDVKPANILLDDEPNAYLADFGIAKDLAYAGGDMTAAGAFVGSPAYSSPEQIRAEPVTPQTDIYALGILLFELFTGQRPFRGTTQAELIQSHLTGSIPPVSQVCLDLPPQLDAVIQRATAKVASARYADVATLAADLAAAFQRPSADRPAPARRSEEIAAPTVVLGLEDSDSPYVGLRAFGEGEASLFFGREALQQQILARLSESGDLARFLAVVGPSGSGKSSVVRAGLVPALRAGALPASEHWYIVDLLPGADPFAALASALWRVAPAGADADDLLALLRADVRGLLRAARLVLPPDPSVELVLVIDQFEELFSLTEDETTRVALLDALVVATLDERSRVRTVVTIRADYLDRPLRYVDFGELLTRRSELVLPMSAEELERAIVVPAAHAGVVLEEGLATMLVGDVEQQPGGLPLLQHALSELFLRRNGRELTRAAYREIGGVAGAIAGSAEASYSALDAAGQALSRQVFLRLVAIGEAGEETRRRVRRRELAGLGDDALLNQALAMFGGARLLSFDHDAATREPTVEVAHEALLRMWPRLRGWIDAARETLLVQRRLAQAAAEWWEAGEDPSYLVSGARQGQFAALMSGGTLALTAAERRFLEESQRAAEQAALAERERQEQELMLARGREAAQRSAARRLRALVVGLAVFLLVAIGLSTFALQQRAVAQSNLARAEAQRLAAEASRLLSQGGSGEVAALLAVRSIRGQYSPQGDEALEAALRADLPTQILPMGESPLNDAVYTPDGRAAVLALQSGEVVIWDLEVGRETRRIAAHTREVTRIAIAADGAQLLTAGADGTARLWELASGARVHEFAIGNVPAQVALFTPDGSAVVTNGVDGVGLWDRASGALIQRYPTGPLVMSMAVSPDGGALLTGSFDGRAALWDLERAELLREYPGSEAGIGAVTFSPDGTVIVAGSLDTQVRVYDRASGQLLHTLAGHTGYVMDVAFSPDGGTIATASWDGTARIWRVADGALVRRLTGHANMVFGIVFSPDGGSLLTASYDRSARVWAMAPAPRPFRTLDAGSGAVQALAIAPDGRSFVTGGRDTRMWSLPDGQLLSTLPHAAGALAYAPDGSSVATVGPDGLLRLWDAAHGVELHQASYQALNSVAISPDGARMLVGGLPDFSARLLEAATLRELAQLTGHTNVVSSVAFAPDGSYLVTGSDDGTARVWSADGATVLRTLSGHTDRLWWLAVTPNSEQIVTASLDQTVRVWDARSGRELRRLIGHTRGVVGVAVSRSGKHAVSASFDRSARLWELETGRELRRFVGHSGDLGSGGAVAISPDDRFVLTGSADGTVRLWDVALGDAETALCGRLLRDFTADERAQYSLPDDEPTCRLSYTSGAAP